MEIRKINWNVEFKKEMSELELYGIERVIDNYWYDETFDFDSEVLGLAYTSSSQYAMYNVCNGDFTYYDEDLREDLTISHFAVTSTGHLVMICNDRIENEFMFELV